MSRTDPFTAAVERLPASSFRVVSWAKVYPAGSASGLDLTVLSGRLSYDARRTPYVVATIEVGWPPASVRRALDPRLGMTLEVFAGYELVPTSRRDVHRLAALRVESVVTDHVARTVTLEAYSDEAVVVGYPAHQAYSYAAGTNVVDAIKAQVDACFPGSTTWDTTGTNTGVDFATAQALQVGEDRWEAITDWAETLHAKAYHDGLGTWHLERIPTGPGGASSALIRSGPRGTLKALTITESREAWGNRAAVIYEHKSGTTAATITTDAALATTTLTPPKMVTLTRKRKPDRPERAARLALIRALRRGHAATLSATAYLWVRPRSTVTVDLPGGGQERLLVEAVTFDLAAGQMTVEAQDDANALIATIT